MHVHCTFFDMQTVQSSFSYEVLYSMFMLIHMIPRVECENSHLPTGFKKSHCQDSYQC